MSTRMSSLSRVRRACSDVLIVIVLSLVAYGIKLHASQANATELTWILGPTAMLAGVLAGSLFTFEQGVGFVSSDLNVAITCACSGTNFLVAALVALGLLGVGRIAHVRSGIAWLLGCAALAYAATVGVNALRVLLVSHVGPHHRAMGTALYVSSLLLLHLGARRLVGRIA